MTKNGHFSEGTAEAAGEFVDGAGLLGVLEAAGQRWDLVAVFFLVLWGGMNFSFRRAESTRLKLFPK